MSEPYTKKNEALPRLAEADRRRVLVEWNDTGKDYPIDQCLHQLVEQQAGRTPEAVALVFGGRTLTYRELNGRANQLAHHLRALGVGADSLVGVCVERSFEMVIGLLGTLKAGGAYVPLDPEYPKDRLAFMIEDANVPVLLTQEHLVAGLPTHGARVVCLDADRDQIAREITDNPCCITGPDQLAYMIYTSGSTGKPKGAMNHHRGICNRLLWMQDEYGLTGTDTVMQKTPFSFDVSVWEFFWPLLTGARLVIARPGGHRDPAYLVRLIEEQEVSVLHFVPSMLQIFLEEPGLERCGSLRHVICSGEALPYAVQEKFFSRLPAELHNLYGPTEAAVDVTYWKCQRGIARQVVPIGRPVANTQCYILDANLHPVPVGEAGELHLGGVQIGYGYHNRPELTAEKFIPDPFRSEPGARLYKTGDIARYLSDGSIEYLGRIDDQVKIRGFRIELGEIESWLRKYPSVRDCAVVAREDQPGQKRLVAYLVTSNKDVFSVQQLRAFVQQQLPDYMVPAAFVMLDALPLSPNGKLDRKALPVPVQTRPELANTYVAPRTPDESLLAEIWSKVLQAQPVGVHDNYFELGGDSIRVIQMLARARQKGLYLTLEQVYKEQTIEKLVPCLRSTSVESPPAPGLQPFELIAVEDRRKLPTDLEDAYPLAALQEGMHFHCELKPDSAMFHDIFSFRIIAAFDQPKLETGLHQLVSRHAALRTFFDFVHYSEPLQLVHREVRVPLTVEDLCHLTPEGQRTALLTWFAAEKQRPFRWEEAPLVRFHVHVYGEQRFQFIVSFHHVILDGWSLAALLTELFQDYFAMLSGARPSLPPLRARYRDYVALEKKAANSDEHRRFWSRKLAHPTVSALPRWSRSMCKGGSEQVRGPEIFVPSMLLDGLKRLALTAGVPLRTVLHAAHMKVMSVMYGSPDVLSGLLTNGRQEELDAEQMIGLFLNAVPFRMQLTGGSWLELCRQTFAAEQEIIPYRRFPLVEAQKLAAGQPLFEVLFDFVNFHAFRGLEGYPNCGFEEGHYFEANNFAASVNFLLNSTSTVLEFHVDYDPEQLPEELIRGLNGYYLRTLTAMASDSAVRYETYSPLSETENKELLVDWNDTAGGYPADALMQDLFEAQVERTPGRTALRFGATALSYVELDARATRLAQVLRLRGVGRGQRVGLCVQRGSDMLTAVLGILKAGAAYVPLDPDYPEERLRFMAQDAQLALLVATTERAGSFGLPRERQLLLDADAASIAAAPDTRLPVGACSAQPEDPAYVIYTSGSTGKPKGVVVPHRAVVNFLTSMAREPGLTADDVLVAVTTLSFDIAVLELQLPLTLGATVVIASRDETVDGHALSTLLEQQRATVMQATPVTWRLLVEAGWKAGKDFKALVGGEALPKDLADQLIARGVELWNMYGPTETTVWSTCARIADTSNGITIGKPIANTTVRILDAQKQLCPTGVPGELCIGGNGVALGYWNRPESTAERFILDPFSTTPRATLYRTGDLARWRNDGMLEHLGRLDDQVKLRGFRIELAEIEANLAEHPDVREAAVHLWRVKANDVRIVACCVLAKAGALAPVSLRKHLRARLPEYMIPQHFLPVNEIPLTPNGKVDRRQLPKPVAAESTIGRHEAPADPVEVAIAEIWTRLIQPARPIGRSDQFFEMGGHSLLALRALQQIENRLGVKLEFRVLFQESLAEIATQIRSRRMLEPNERTARGIS